MKKIVFSDDNMNRIMAFNLKNLGHQLHNG